MRFSIIAPNLNEMPFIEDLFLRGLEDQTFRDFELIIVDGYSRDGSLEAIERARHRGLNVKIVYTSVKNFGYLRNLGCSHSRGEILFNTCTDTWFPPRLLEKLDRFYRERPGTVALGGRVVPWGRGAGLICHVAYGLFDLARFAMTTRFMAVRKIRPSGNFLSIYRDVFFETGRYPEVTTNEDGLFGYKLDEYQRRHPDKTVRFSIEHHVRHNVKTFEEKGPIGGVLFYFYVLALLFPWLHPLLKPIEEKTGREFVARAQARSEILEEATT